MAKYITNENMARVLEVLRDLGVKDEVHIDVLRKASCKIIRSGDMSVVSRFLQAGSNMGYWVKKDFSTWTIISRAEQTKLEEV